MTRTWTCMLKRPRHNVGSAAARMRGLTLTGAVAAMLPFAGATAQAAITANVKPARPYVDDTLRVSFKTDRALKPGYVWRVVIVSRTCGLLAYRDAPDSRRKGAVVRIALRPS